MNEISEKLLNAGKDGNFLEAACKIYLQQKDDKKSIGKEIASLHNKGAINAIEEFRKLSKGLKGTDFFLTRYIFEDALPELNAPVLSVMDCVKHLVNEAGDDMAAGLPFKQFTKYCEADLNRSKEVLQIIESSGDEWSDFIPSAIIAGSNLHLSEYVLIAIKLTLHDNLKVRVQAVFTLGRINYCSNTSLIRNAIKALERAVQSENNDLLLGNAITSAFSLYLADKNIEKSIINLIKTALSEKGDFALYSASELFAFHNDKIPAKLMDVLIGALKSCKPESKGTLRNIDYGLEHLIKNNQEETAISFLEHLLVKNDNELSIKDFKSLAHSLYGRDNLPILNKLATRWFISKKIPLCRGVKDIVQLGHDKSIVLIADKEQLAEQPKGTCLFAARKAVGWLFISPISCTSFIVSLLDISSDDEIEQIADLLFYPILISYPSSAKIYLKSLLPDKSQKVQKILTDLLDKLKNYHEDLKSAWDIPELLPSQTQRETHLRRFNRQMRDSYKEAEKQSVFSSVISKSVLLYGRKSINYIHGPNDQINRMEIPLQRFEHSIEFPSLNYMDPHGLDYMLRVFSIEGCN